ncbi:hypothetical protein [Modestobacter sp. NPDC049651]|uniref:hypothetical protein n=1 Tax=unclassified Modestobacter TaxID=2643866 RepID=UPI00340F8D1C
MTNRSRGDRRSRSLPGIPTPRPVPPLHPPVVDGPPEEVRAAVPQPRAEEVAVDESGLGDALEIAVPVPADWQEALLPQWLAGEVARYEADLVGDAAAAPRTDPAPPPADAPLPAVVPAIVESAPAPAVVAAPEPAWPAPVAAPAPEPAPGPVDAPEQWPTTPAVPVAVAVAVDEPHPPLDRPLVDQPWPLATSAVLAAPAAAPGTAELPPIWTDTPRTSASSTRRPAPVEPPLAVTAPVPPRRRARVLVPLALLVVGGIATASVLASGGERATPAAAVRADQETATAAPTSPARRPAPTPAAPTAPSSAVATSAAPSSVELVPAGAGTAVPGTRTETAAARLARVRVPSTTPATAPAAPSGATPSSTPPSSTTPSSAPPASAVPTVVPFDPSEDLLRAADPAAGNYPDSDGQPLPTGQAPPTTGTDAPSGDGAGGGGDACATPPAGGTGPGSGGGAPAGATSAEPATTPGATAAPGGDATPSSTTDTPPATATPTGGPAPCAG